MEPDRLLEAIKIPDSPGDKPYIIEFEAILKICRNLIIVDDQLNAVRFAHLSVQEFFDGIFSPVDTNRTAATICLSLLCSPGTWLKPDDTRRELKALESFRHWMSRRPSNHAYLLKYAVMHWFAHADFCSTQEPVEGLLETFLDSGPFGTFFSGWLAAVWALDISLKGYGIPEHRLDPDPVFVICHLGFSGVFRTFHLRHKFDVNMQSHCGESLLYVSSSEGHVELMELLLEMGADVNAKGRDGTNALEIAAYSGHEKAVNLLLAHGAEINAQSEDHGTALQAAAGEGHEKLVDRLLAKGADVLLGGGPYMCPLHAAARSGYLNIVKTLLDRGADVNAEGGWFGSALQVAASSDHEPIVKLLLDSGANLCGNGEDFTSALEAAVWHRRATVVELLLNRGADVNQYVDHFHGTVLSLAVHLGHREIAELLLQYGADVHAPVRGFGTVLIAALEFYLCTPEMIELLLVHGAEVNHRGSNSIYPLHAAIQSRGSKRIVALLLDYGADVNTDRDIKEGSALQLAVRKGYNIEMVKRLLSKGASVNLVSDQYGTALQAARLLPGGEKDAMVNLLLEYGVEPKNLAPRVLEIQQ